MQASWRGFIHRAKWAERKACITIQLFYRKYKFRKYFRDLNKTFASVKNDKDWGKNFRWPEHPAILDNGVTLLHKVHANWRAKMMITSLTPQQQAHMRQKVLAYTIFKGNKPWAYSRPFEAEYLGLDSNPHKENYIAGMQILFNSYGDAEVHFADYVMKVNKVGKAQKRGIVVTEKNIYKHDPKNYKVKKFGTPLINVQSISVSRQKDSFCVVHCKVPYRDFVLDLGIDGTPEKYSEFVTVLVQEIRKLTGNTVDVQFNDRIQYNNSRNEKKPGLDCALTFETTLDPKQKGSTYKNGKNNVNIVVFRG
jgi:myosin-1